MFSVKIIYSLLATWGLSFTVCLYKPSLSTTAPCALDILLLDVLFLFSGGYVYIYHSPEMPYAWKNDDGYHWSEILHQMDMLTAKGTSIKIF